MNQPLNTQEGSGLLKALLRNCVYVHFLVHWAIVRQHICQILLKPPALQTRMLNSPSWISKAMLVIFCVITIMGLLKDVTQEQVKSVKRLHYIFLKI